MIKTQYLFFQQSAILALIDGNQKKRTGLVDALKLLLFDSVIHSLTIVYYSIYITGFFFQYTKLFTIQEQFPLDDNDAPCDSDEVYDHFFANWCPKVARELKENPNAAKSSNVRKKK